MKRSWFLFAVAIATAGLSAAACGDDEVFADRVDAGFDGPFPTPPQEPPTPPGNDGGPSGCLPSTGAPPRLLLTMTSIGAGQKESELAAINLTTKVVDGRLHYPGAFGTTWSVGADPFLLAEQKDIVTRLDSKEPWKGISSWNVAGDDAFDGGGKFAEPVAVAVPACGKGYVLRFNRNKIAVIDTAKVSDGGAPTKYIDLASLLQSEDKDGKIEMTAALHVPSKKRIYVLLGNVDFKKIATDGFTALCATTKPSIVAIDTDTDALVSLGGTGPGGSILLPGYNPPIGLALAYDAALDRLLVLEGGCNLDDGDGGAGAIARRGVDAVSLATGQASTLVTIPDQYFPTTLAFADGTHAVLGLVDQFTFEGKAFFWDPSSSSLGAPIPGRIDGIAFDTKTHLVGARVGFVDGGQTIEVVGLPYGDGGIDAGDIQILTTNPFTDNTGFLGGAEVWPH